MIATAIVSLLLTAAATVPPTTPPLSGQDQAVQVRLDKDGDYYPGHDAQVAVEPKYDGFLLVLHVDPAGQLRVLFPLEPFDEAFVEGGKKYELVNRGGLGSFYVGEADGIGTVFAAHSDFPFHVNPFATDHRWDYQALQIPLETDLETALVDLVAKMSYDGWFEYDLVEYQVYGEGSYAGGGPSYNIYYQPYSICCQTSVAASIFVGTGWYYPYGYPWYFSSYWYYPSHHYYGSYYGYPYYRGGYRPGRHYAGGYPHGRDYRFKPQYRYDRDRSPDQYRPRVGVGVDAGRHGFGGGGIDYRGRRSPSATPVASPPSRRRTVTTVATAGGSSTGGTRPSGRVGSRRTGPSPRVADRSRPAGRTARGGGGVDSPRQRTAGTTRSRPGGRAGEPTRRTRASTPRTAPKPRQRGESLGRPVLKRSQPIVRQVPRSRPDVSRPGRTARSGRTSSPRASRPPSQRPTSRVSRPSRPSRPQARSGGASRASAGARAPTRSQARSRGGGSRRKP